MRVVPVALTAAMTLALTACGGADTKAAVFGAEDLPRLVLQPSDVPTGWPDSVDVTKEVEADWTDGDSPLERLKALGLQGMRFARFEPADYGEGGVLSGAFLFEDSDGASRALDYIREGLREPLLGSEPLATNVAADGLGEESWGLTSAESMSYGFRVGNAVIFLDAFGDVDARGLAKKAAKRVSAMQ